MTTDTVKNAKTTTGSVVKFVFFETLATEKSATVLFYQILTLVKFYVSESKYYLRGETRQDLTIILLLLKKCSV